MRLILLLTILIFGLSGLVQAKSEDKSVTLPTSSQYQFINKLNIALKSQLNQENVIGIKHISTLQKNQQIIIQVIHNPQISYQFLIDDIAKSASRVNGVNFQNNFTLNVLEIYCQSDLFYEIQAHGLDKQVTIHYMNHRHAPITSHRINRSLCS